MTNELTHIHLIRHGEVHNPQQILYGRLPRFALSANGRRQARQTGAHLSNVPIQAVFSSPMLRTRQTTRLMFDHGGRFKVHISSLLNEVCTAFQGMPGAEIDARNGDVYTGADACFEQPRDVVARTRKFIARMRRHFAGGQVVAVTHGDVIAFLVLWAKGFDPTPGNKPRLKYAGYPVSYPAHASITSLTYQTVSPHEKPKMHYWQPEFIKEGFETTSNLEG